MNHYPMQEPQGQQRNPHDPYNPYATQREQETYPSQQELPTHLSQQGQPTYVPPSPYATQLPSASYPPPPYPVPQQPMYGAPINSQGQRMDAKKAGAQAWNRLVSFLGVRGVAVAAGSLLAALSFLILPYYSNYSGYFLAAETLDDKWWLELILPIVALAIVVALQVMPRLRQRQRRWSLVIAGSGLLAILLNYWFLYGQISTSYWRLGAWGYFLGMALVAIGGLALAL